MGQIAIPVLSDGTSEISMVKTPQSKSNPFTVDVSGYKTYILWVRGSSVSHINSTTATASNSTVTQLFKSTSILSTVNCYAIYQIVANNTNTITITITGNTTEFMVIGV